MALLIDRHHFHAAASGWLEEVTKLEDAAFCRATQQSVLRLLTTASVFMPHERPLTNVQAWAAYRGLQADQRITFVEEPPGTEAHWERLTSRHTVSPKIWMDAYLAAFAIAGGYRLVTTDAGFRHYEGLDLVVLKER